MRYKKKLLVTMLGVFAAAGAAQVQAGPSAEMMANTLSLIHI